MWLINWLTARFSALTQLLDILFQPIVNIVNNVIAWIFNAQNTATQNSNIFAVGRDTILDLVLRQFTNFLHILGIQDTDVKVGSERQTRTQVDTVLDMKVDAKDAEHKEALQRKAAQLETKVDIQDGKLQRNIDLGDTSNRERIDMVLDALDRHKLDWSSWFRSVGEIITNFGRDPLGFIARLLFECVVEIVLYQLAVGLARPGLDIGSPPQFGINANGAITPDEPPLGEQYAVLLPLRTPKGLGQGYSYPSHQGIDLIGEKGDSVFSGIGGTVKDVHRNDPVLGGVLQIEGKYSITVYYGLTDILVNVGQSVKPDTKIGHVGLTIHGKDNTLHFEVRIKGVAVDPVPLFRRWN